MSGVGAHTGPVIIRAENAALVRKKDVKGENRSESCLASAVSSPCPCAGVTAGSSTRRAALSLFLLIVQFQNFQSPNSRP